MSGIDPNSPAGKAIAQQLDNPGQYSISQLYADFNSEYMLLQPSGASLRILGGRIQRECVCVCVCERERESPMIGTETNNSQ